MAGRAGDGPVVPGVGGLSAEPRVLWKPQAGPQTVFLTSAAFEVLYGGAVGGGKSQALLYGALRQIGIPSYRALILRKTFPELRELMDEAIAVFGDLGGKWIASEKRFEFPSGATVEFGYCTTYEDVMQYRGQQYQYIAYDEIGDLPDERVWIFLLTRIRSGVDARLVKMARCSANPGGAGHAWIKRRFITPCPPDGTPIFDEDGNSRAFVQAKLKDNPALLEKDPSYIKRLKLLPEMMQQQLLEGDWEAGTGLAFERLGERSHLVPKAEVPKWARCFGALDWGYGHRWTFSVAYAEADGKIHVIDTTFGTRDIPLDIAQSVRELLETRGLRISDLTYVVSGSDLTSEERARGSFGPSIREQLATCGLFTMNADQNRPGGFQNLLSYIDTGKIVWEDTPGNRRVIAQLREMVMNPDRPNDVLKIHYDQLKDEGGDDFYDMTRYLAMSRPLASVMPASQRDRRDVSTFERRPKPEAFTGYRMPLIGAATSRYTTETL